MNKRVETFYEFISKKHSHSAVQMSFKYNISYTLPFQGKNVLFTHTKNRMILFLSEELSIARKFLSSQMSDKRKKFSERDEIFNRSILFKTHFDSSSNPKLSNLAKLIIYPSEN